MRIIASFKSNGIMNEYEELLRDAVMAGDAELFEEIANTCEVDFTNQKIAHELLYLACLHGRRDILGVLIDKGISLYEGIVWSVCTHETVDCMVYDRDDDARYADVVRFLVHHGADPNFITNGVSPLDAIHEDAYPEIHKALKEAVAGS